MCFKTSGTSERLLDIRTDEDDIYMFLTDGVLYLDNDSGNYEIMVPQPNIWYHVAITYDDDDNKWYTSVNGVTTYKDTFNFDDGGTPRSLSIGGDSNPFYSGSISNFRVSRYPRYTSNFTVPSLPLSAEGASSLILGTPWAPFYDSVRNENSVRTCDVLLGPISIGVYTVTTLEYNTDLGPSFSWSGGTFIRKTESPYIYAGVVTSIEEVPSPGNLIGATLGHSVKSIGFRAFYDCTSVSSIAIPNSVRSIGNDAFYNCTSLTSIDIPNSVTSIGNGAFRNCSSLISIDIPNSVTSIGEGVFEGCTSLTSIDIPNSVTSIDDYAFSGCTSLSSITIPNSVTSIGDLAFNNCPSFETVTLGNSVQSIGLGAFRFCTSLTSINIPNSVRSIGGGVFYASNLLTTIAIPNSVTSISEYAFLGSGLVIVTIASNNPFGIPSPASDVAFFGTTVQTILP
jgi:hypothetical protein